MMTGMGDTTTNQIGVHYAGVIPPEELYDAQKNSLSNWLILGGAALVVLMLLFGGGSSSEE